MIKMVIELSVFSTDIYILSTLSHVAVLVLILDLIVSDTTQQQKEDVREPKNWT